MAARAATAMSSICGRTGTGGGTATPPAHADLSDRGQFRRQFVQAATGDTDHRRHHGHRRQHPTQTTPTATRPPAAAPGPAAPALAARAAPATAMAAPATVLAATAMAMASAAPAAASPTTTPTMAAPRGTGTPPSLSLTLSNFGNATGRYRPSDQTQTEAQTQTATGGRSNWAATRSPPAPP